MERNAIFEKIIELIDNCDYVGLLIKLEQITEKSDLVKDVGFDSLDKIELIMSVEQEYKITIDVDEELKICNISDLIDIIILKK